MLVQGIVKSGGGDVKRSFDAELPSAVRRLFGWTPSPVVLTMRPPGPLAPFLAKLPPPLAKTRSKGNKRMTLQWWPAMLASPSLKEPVLGALVRARQSSVCGVEVVAPVNLKELGLKNGDLLRAALISPSSWAEHIRSGRT